MNILLFIIFSSVGGCVAFYLWCLYVGLEDSKHFKREFAIVISMIIIMVLGFVLFAEIEDTLLNLMYWIIVAYSISVGLISTIIFLLFLGEFQLLTNHEIKRSLLCTILFSIICTVLVFTILFYLNNKSEAEANKYIYTAELKDGTIEKAKSCYTHDKKKICKLKSMDEMIVEDYWMNKETRD